MKTGMKILLGFILSMMIISGVYAYYSFFYTPSGVKTVILQNPAVGLSEKDAVESFNESFVLYLLYSIGAQNLHNPLLSSDTPKINFYIEEDVYSAEIVKGRINIEKGKIDGEDIVIRTPVVEAVKMIRDRNYIDTSFAEGKSSIELVSGKPALLSKGYLKLYTSLTGKKVE